MSNTYPVTPEQKNNDVPKVEIRVSSRPTSCQTNVSCCTLHLGDCLVEMCKIPDSSCDMIFADLPYGTTNCDWDILLPFDKLWQQWHRIAKENAAIVLTAQQPFATDVINSNRKYFRYEIIWEKTQKLGFLNCKKMPLRGHENILIFYKKLPTYNPQKTVAETKRKNRIKVERVGGVYQSHTTATDWIDDGLRFPSSVIKVGNWNGGGFTNNPTKHPTQKPVELLDWLIKTYTNEGDTVLDCVMGSGTTGVSCKKNNRHFIGIEKNKTFFEIADQRITEYNS